MEIKMRKLKLYQKIFLVLLTSTLAVVASAYISVLFTFPGELILIEGEESVYNFRNPFPLNISADQEGIIELNGGELKAAGSVVHFSGPVSFRSQRNGSVRLNVRLFGLLPVKTMRVDVVSNREVVACGNTVGVKLRLDGILVIGLSDVETPDGRSILPAKDSGIRPGCFITGVNDHSMKEIEDLIREVEKSEGKPLKINFRHGNTRGSAHVVPVMSADDQKYHIGLWVRDSTAGIGTLTFYDPDSKTFGALGHGITDIDTGTLMPVASGEILESSILGVKVGKSGVPGELKGIFIEDTKLGIIRSNSDFGIYGKLSDEFTSKATRKLYPVGLRSEIEEGPATILSNIDGKSIEEFQIEIQKVSRQNVNGTKGMIIKVTDPKLLESTGGIVQGMSGSPILQKEKIVGAVTHVLVNDPTRGYGIFIENMLKNINEAQK